MKKINRIDEKIILFFLFFLSFSSFSNCEKDLKTFCKKVPSIPVYQKECLYKVKSKLSPACTEHMMKVRAKQLKKNKCLIDSEKLCPGIFKVKSLNSCLEKNVKKLSKECLQQREKKIAKKYPCKKDMEKLCPKEFKSKDKKALEVCMLKNKSKLAPTCKEAREKFLTKKSKKLPCFKDIKTYCPGIKPGGSKINTCLKKNEDKLSHACKIERKKLFTKFRIKNKCFDDFEKYCPSLKRKPKKLKACIKKNMDNFSVQCRYQLEDRKKRRSSIKADCKEDDKKFCKNVKAKGRAKLRCLRQNREKLSKSCKNHFFK